MVNPRNIKENKMYVLNTHLIKARKNFFYHSWSRGVVDGNDDYNIKLEHENDEF